MSLSATEEEKWLTAHHNRMAGLFTFSACMALADLGADGEHKLIIADLGSNNQSMKLKVRRNFH